jgi:hypothetical protein
MKPVARASFRTPTPRPYVPPAQWREELRAAYRLPPDARFLLAAGELDRLTAPAAKADAAKTLSAAKPADATFTDGRWTIRSGDTVIGQVPELPEFADLFALLVANANRRLGPAASGTAPELAPSNAVFLMPALSNGFAEEGRALARGLYMPAARSWSRLTFQMPDRLGLAPLIPARALAVLALARSRDAHAGVAEEALLAHALGYTRHAASLAGALPADSPVRAFVTADSNAIAAAASRADATEEARYLAVRHATARGELATWSQARERYLHGNDSVAVVATGLEMDLPQQVEVYDRGIELLKALPRAIVRELARLPNSMPPNFEANLEFASNLKRASAAADGPLWDGAAIGAYYEAAYYSSMGEGYSPQLYAGAGGQIAYISNEFWRTRAAPDPRGDPRGSGLVLRWVRWRFQEDPPGDLQAFAEMRALMRWLDTRPTHRAALARLSQFQLDDARQAEDLYRAVQRSMRDADRKPMADAAIFLGDREFLRRLFSSPDLSQPEATAILWSWYVSKADPDAMSAEWERTIERFPHDWGPTNTYIDILRKQRNYRKACQVVERWLARNPDPRSPGRYHAHIRLAHNYALTGEYAKGLALLEGMQESEWFQKANQKRGMAECLAGLGRFAEAEKLAREAATELAEQSEATRYLIKILWMGGKDEDAAALTTRPPLAEWERCDVLRIELPQALEGAPPARVDHALDALAKQPGVARWWSSCAIEGFGNAGRWEDALRVDQHGPLGNGDAGVERLVTLYGYAKSARGKEAAAQWLNQRLPAGSRNSISPKAVYLKQYEILWDVIGTPDPNDHPEWVWLLRAVAFALAPQDGSHRAELEAYYSRPSEERYHVMGRYVLGLASEDEMLALASKGAPRSEIAYYAGVRAQHEGRYRDACEWYRVAAESGEVTGPRTLALHALGEWEAMGQGLWRLEARR